MAGKIFGGTYIGARVQASSDENDAIFPAIAKHGWKNIWRNLCRDALKHRGANDIGFCRSDFSRDSMLHICRD
jgi:hypothetical protein